MSRLSAALLLILVPMARAEAQVPSPPQTALAASGSPAALSPGFVRPPAAAATDPLLAEENLLLFDVSLDRLALTDSLATYAAPGGPLIPIGELTRLLDVDLSVSVPERRITGTVGQARRPVLIDLATGLIRLDGLAAQLAPGDVVVGATDLYVRPALLERILPLKVTVDMAGLRIVLAALEPLPIQSRLDRLGKLRALQPDVQRSEDILRLATPHRLASLPSFDVSMATALQSRTPHFPRRYDVRAGADVLYTGFQGYVGSNDSGTPTTARLLFERRDPTGRLFGPLGVTRASAGDIFTPTLAIGPRSVGGRGISFTTAPLEQASVFERIDLRGELPIGYDVELYVNDVLRSGQQSPSQGRYEFLNVPLVRGVNVVRVVSYGPRGERNEEVRVISVGGGQVPKGKLVVDFGAVQQDRDLIELGRQDGLQNSRPGNGRPRFALNAAYGLTTGLTLTGGASTYSPDGVDTRQLVALGMRTSILGWATQVDAAHDSDGGSGIALGLAGRPFGISTILRHAEYRGGFIDETVPNGGDGRALNRYSELTFDLSTKPIGGTSIPLSGRIERDQFSNGDIDVAAAVRASTALGRALISTGLDYVRTSPQSAATSDRLTGILTASTYAAFKWQLRAGLDFDLSPSAHLRATTLTADRNIDRNIAIRFGLAHSFEADRSSTFQASTIFRLPFGDLSLDGDYSMPTHGWRVGLAYAFSLGYDPLSGRYAARRIGAGSGGNLALQAFVDANDNNRYDPGEQVVPGVTVSNGLDEATTDAQGRAFVTGLGYSPVTRVRTGIDNVDLPNVDTPPRTIEFIPRAGVAAVAMYPLKVQGEVLVRLLFRQSDGKLIGLSAVHLRAIRQDGVVREASTEYDGSAIFERLPAGRYRLEIEPAQASRLKMHLAEPLAIIVPEGGGVLPDLKATVEFDRQ